MTLYPEGKDLHIRNVYVFIASPQILPNLRRDQKGFHYEDVHPLAPAYIIVPLPLKNMTVPNFEKIVVNWATALLAVFFVSCSTDRRRWDRRTQELVVPP